LAEISPFQGIRYNQNKIGDMAKVICPPYDIISPEDQKRYYERSEYNIVRLEYGLTYPEDNETNNRYTRSRDSFNQWLKDGILQTDISPSFYIYEQHFTYRDVRKKRIGLVACVLLEPWEKKVVLPHEQTIHGVKLDRLELMKACNSNISPIFGLYDDPGNRVGKLVQEKMSRSRLVAECNEGLEAHKLWRANEPEFVQRVSHFMNPKPIYIADGHHRYETALAYRDERRQSAPSYSGDEAYNFVMMILVPFSDPGLVALPIHRVIKGIPSERLTELKAQLEGFFDIQETPVSNSNLDETRGSDIRIIGLEPDSMLELRLKRSVSLDGTMPEGHSRAYKGLNVSIVEHLIIEKMLGITEEDDSVVYSQDVRYARKLVEGGEYQLAVILSPIPVTTIQAVADSNDRMPRKSTYFYPKLPTGLVLNRLDGRL
jgi:uncharacterized protein (DUF1015 family)